MKTDKSKMSFYILEIYMWKLKFKIVKSLDVPCGMQDLSSVTRGQTCTPCRGGREWSLSSWTVPEAEI